MSTIDEESLSISSECTTINDCQDILCILSDSEDSENHRINMVLYHYAKAIKSLSSNPSFTEMLIESATLDVNSLGVSINELAAQDELFLVALNEALRQSINHENVFPRFNSDFESTENISDYLTEYFTYNGYSYLPVIYFIKQPENLDNSELNIFIAEEVTECDEVFGWVNDLPKYVSEDQIMNSNALNIFVGVGERSQEEYVDPLINEKLTTDLNERSVSVNVDYTSYQIKKGYRYERSKNSEIRAGVKLFYPGVPDDTFTARFLEVDVAKNDINNSKKFNEQDIAVKMENSDFDRFKEVFLYSWERDWYASHKDIPNECSSTTGHGIATRRKFAHEWYFYDCGILKEMFPSVDDTKKINNQKCSYNFLRTQ